MSPQAAVRCWDGEGVSRQPPLGRISAMRYEGGHDGIGKALTLRMASRSLVRYARTALIATRRPSYIPRDTSAKPPHSTSTESSEQSGMCMDVGITRWRLHVLQSLLRSFSRSRSDIGSFSRRCNSCQSSVSTLGDVERLTLFISSTCVWISDSEFCRNRKKVTIPGRIPPGHCRWLGG